MLEHRELRARQGELEAIVAGQALSAFRDAEAIRLDALHRLALAAEYRDDNSPEHTQRVAALAARMARHLGEGDRAVWLVRQAAPLHDLGKIAIPDSILLKPGRLEPEEYEVVKTHAVLGARVLEGGDSELLAVAERIARSHHERWDGGGYPDGLAGEAIPLVARLVAVADVFDVLVHERPYKEAWSVEDAAGEIRAARGHAVRSRGGRGVRRARRRRLDGRTEVQLTGPGLKPAAGPGDGRRDGPFRSARGRRRRRGARLRLRRRPLPTSTIPSPSGLRIENTAGRLGGAVTLEPGAPLRRLAPPGRPDLRERRDAPRRDGVGAGAACAGPDVAPAPATLAAVAATTLCLLNGERADHGLPPLATNPQLGAAADRLRAGPRRGLVLLPHRPRRLDAARPHPRRRLRAGRTGPGGSARTSPGAPACSPRPARSCAHG